MKNLFKIMSLLTAASVAVACTDDKDELSADFTSSHQTVLAGQSVEFYDLSGGQPSAWNWTFEGGDPQSSAMSSPRVVYNTPGTYSVTLEIRNSKGAAIKVKESYITVDYDELTVDFEAETTTVIEGETVGFKDLSTGLPDTWKWTFKSTGGKEYTSTERNPRLEFEEGIYSVILEASNPKYSDIATKTNYLTVLDPYNVAAGFEADFAGTYTGGTVNFTDRSIGNVETWQWTFEGGSPATSNVQNPSVTYSQPGRYKVTLKVANSYFDATEEKEDYIVVVPGDGLTMFFPLDGNIGDAGPYKLQTSLTHEDGTVAFGDDRRGQAGRTGLFDGSTGFWTPFHSAFDFQTGDFSVSVWVRNDKQSVRQQMMIWMAGGFSSGDMQTWLRLYSNASRNVTLNIEKGGTIHITDSNWDNIGDDQWHHIVCVRQGGMSYIYIDGQVAGTASRTEPGEIDSTLPFKVGIQQTGESTFSNAYEGMLDDLIVYKRALSAQEVMELYQL
ncbi:MAG: PKD domain-containing protein [Alistipes sp.]|nr:PKD domain-containing protein [Alistipes sp.]